MILFQIDNNDRSFMHDLLVRYFDFQGFCGSLRKKYPEIESAEFKRLSTQNASLHTDLFKSLLLFVREFLDEHFHHYFSVGTEMFDSFDDADDSFFWDTVIALYTQLVYDQSTPTTMRDFYVSNFEEYGIKYDSYTDYFKSHIFDQPMGEYLNIHPHNPEKSHPRRYIRNCFPTQQYALIHSFSKSPYRKPSSNAIQTPLKMQEYILSTLLEQETAYAEPQIYHFHEIVQSVCEKISQKSLDADKKQFLFRRDPRENQMENQLTAYIVEQAYHYEIFSQAAIANDITDRFKQLRIHDKKLYKKISERMKDAKKLELAQGLSSPEIVKFLSHDTEIATYTQEVSSFQKQLEAVSDIGCVSAVLSRPYIIAQRLDSRCWVPEAFGYRLVSPKNFNPILYMANAYIPLVQEFYLQTLLWLFPIPDSKIDLHRFLRQLLIENLDEWKINNATVGSLGLTEGRILGLLFEISRAKHRTVDAIQKEYSTLDFSKRILRSQ